MIFFYSKIFPLPTELLRHPENNKEAVFIAHGELNLNALNLSILKQKPIIAVDGGLTYCHQLELQPFVLIGDFDSVIPGLLENYSSFSTIHLNRDKDETDLEEALKYINETQNFNRYTIIGGTGKRIDHLHANLNLISRYPMKAFLETPDLTIFALDYTTPLIEIPSFPDQVISLHPINGEIHHILSSGLVWELQEGFTLSKSFYGTSNRAKSTTFTLKVTHPSQGQLLCFLHKFPFI